MGAGFDDLAGEGEAVDDRGAESGVGEGFCPGRERFVGGDRDRRAFLSLGQDLEEQLGAAAVELQVAQFVDEQQVDAAVAGDEFGEVFVVGGFDEFVDQLAGQCVADSVAGFGGAGAQADQ